MNIRFLCVVERPVGIMTKFSFFFICLCLPLLLSAQSFTLTEPKDGLAYVDTLPIAWKYGGSEPASHVEITARYISGFSLVTPPPIVRFNCSINAPAVGSFVYQTKNNSNAIVDGVYLITASYFLSGTGIRLVSGNEVRVQISVSTLPAQVLSPVLYGTYQSPVIPFRIFLPSIPLLHEPVILLLKNDTWNMTLQLASTAQTLPFMFNTDTSLIQTGTAVVAVSQRVNISNGTYDVIVSYADAVGHDRVSSLPSRFVVGGDFYCPPCSHIQQHQQQQQITDESTPVSSEIPDIHKVNRILQTVSHPVDPESSGTTTTNTTATECPERSTRKLAYYFVISFMKQQQQ